MRNVLYFREEGERQLLSLSDLQPVTVQGTQNCFDTDTSTKKEKETDFDQDSPLEESLKISLFHSSSL